jgi:large subunit ribosomal protein L14e
VVIVTLPAIEVGKICVKVTGREAGRKCVIVDVIDKNFVLVTGPLEVTGVKRRRVNVGHIEPTKDGIDIDRGANDEDVAKALESSGKTEEMKQLVKP